MKFRRLRKGPIKKNSAQILELELELEGKGLVLWVSQSGPVDERWY